MRIEVKDAADFLRAHDNYLILMHSSPDGDTLGCGYALCGALQRMGKKARAVCPDDIPKKFDYLKEAVKEQNFETDNIICVDIADTKLLGKMKEIGDKAALCIDHHISNTEYAERLLLKADYASAAEIVFEVIKELMVPVDKILADCIYTGVSTDTGCFKYSNTTAKAHKTAAELMELGADFARINYVMFDLKTQGRIKLERTALSNIHYYAGGHIAVITVTKELISDIPDIDSDVVGALSALSRQIEGVDIGICFKEKEDGIFKASLRSSEKINVSEIAAKFGGGGHKRAAGCSFSCPLEEAEKDLVEKCAEAIKNAGIIS